MYRKILVATDGTPLADKAVKSAIGLAKCCGAELVALRVVPRNPLTFWDAGAVMSPSDIERIEAQWQQEAQATVDAAKKTSEAQGVGCKAVTSRSNVPSEAIIAAATKHKADLIVMASHGRKGLKRVILGSETQGVLAHASIPVLVLR
jgi:nucleotide-binding universal stress UspA family protein